MNWDSPTYSDFMINFLKYLEPVKYAKGTIIYNEFDNVNTVNFFMNGKIDIGYDINRIVKYRMRL